jgi:hypothetical protein
MSNTMRTPYVGYNKMQRLEASVKKTLASLGSTVDLRFASYHKLEKLALLLSIERVLRARVNNTTANNINSNTNFIAHVYRVLLQIADKKPLIIGALDKGRFFSLLLLDGGAAGKRLLKKQNVKAMLMESFPYCFEYNDTAADLVNFKLVRVCGLTAPTEQKQSCDCATASAALTASEIIDSIPTLVAAGALMFVAGAAYCWLVLVGLRRL